MPRSATAWTPTPTFRVIHFDDPFTGRESALDVRQEGLKDNPELCCRHVARPDPEKLRLKHSPAREVDEILILAYKNGLQPVGFRRNRKILRVERKNIPDMDSLMSSAGDFGRQSRGQLRIE
jgi:hypothetical protein